MMLAISTASLLKNRCKICGLSRRIRLFCKPSIEVGGAGQRRKKKPDGLNRLVFKQQIWLLVTFISSGRKPPGKKPLSVGVTVPKQGNWQKKHFSMALDNTAMI